MVIGVGIGVGVGVGVGFGFIIILGVFFFGIGLDFGECLGVWGLYLSCKVGVLGFLFLVWVGVFDCKYFLRLFSCFFGIGVILMYFEDWLILWCLYKLRNLCSLFVCLVEV